MTIGRKPESGRASTLAERIQAIARTNPSLDVAQFQFIGLEDIERAFGARWHSQKNKVKQIACDYLRSQIDTGDVLIPGGDGFLIVFGNASGGEAEFVTASLTHGLNEHFLGHAEPVSAARMETQTSAVPVDALVATLGEKDYVDGPADPPAEIQPASVTWAYQPVWNVKRESVSHYMATPVNPNGEPVPGYQFEPLPGRTPRFTSLDEAGLLRAEEDLRELVREGKSSGVGSSLHVTSLTNVDNRLRLFSTLDRFDRALQKFRVVKISNIPPGFPRMYLPEIVGPMKARGLNISMTCAWNEPDLATFLQARPISIGFALPPSVVGPGSIVPQSELLAKVRAAASCAHAARTPFFVEGVFTSAMAIRFSAIGVDMMASHLIWDREPVPRGMVKWSADKLLAA